MKKEDAIALVKANLWRLPVSFRYLDVLRNSNTNNYSTVKYKAATVKGLQTNEEVVGVFYKPISRMIQPFAGEEKDTKA
jgi:hypothetical protein